MRKLYFFIILGFMLLAVSVYGAGNVENDLMENMDQETVFNVMRSMWLYENGQYKYDELPSDVVKMLLDEKNGNESFGKRISFRMEYLLNNPDSYTPDYTYKYDEFMKFTKSLSPHQAYVLSQFFGLDSDKDYKELPAVPDIQFPRDHAVQFDYQVGWHFFVGNCHDEKDVEYGIQLMFWRYSLLPPKMAEYFGLTDEENQIIEYHLAISKDGDRHYSAKPTVISGTTGLLKFDSEPFSYSMGANRIYSLEDSFAPLRLVARGWDETEEITEIEIGITVDQDKEPVLNGKNGACPSVGGVGTLYYSITNMKLVPENSYIKINGEIINLKEGKFWFDHQWANGLSPQGNPRDVSIRALKCLMPPTPSGWDWFMVQFDDDTEMGLSAIHSAENIPFYYQTGQNPPAVMTADLEGKYVDASGNATDVIGILKIDEWIKATKSTDPDRFWITNAWYPNRWEFIFDDENVNVPEGKRHFFMEPIVDNGQYAFFAAGPQYSEGGTYVLNGDGDLLGKGFAESVAYADTTMNMIELTGMPRIKEVIEACKPAEITEQLEFWCLFYLYMSPDGEQLLKLLGK